MPPQIKKYGQTWHPNTSPIDMEIWAIRKGGKWKSKKGEDCGEGLFQHVKNLQMLLWPHKKWHKWNEKLIRRFCEKRIIAILGPASSAKTREAADFGLSWYICFPHETTVLVSSTDIRSLDLRIWGEMKKNWLAAKQNYSKTPGYSIGSKQMIVTDPKDSEARDIRNGIIGIPCMQGGNYQGISKYVGIKNKYVILIGDELQFMPRGYVDSISNLNKNIWFKCLGMGNPKDRTDALGVLAEPSDASGGWDSLDESEVTKEWDTRFEDGICIQLVGTDSPNFDVPEDAPVPFPFLITRKAIASDETLYGRESIQFSMMNLGMMPKDSQSRRVITRSLAVKFNAQEDVVWSGTKLTKVIGLDAAYGSTGGDRCVMVEAQFGVDTRGKQTFSAGKPIIIPVSGKLAEIPEDQIAAYVRNYCQLHEIPPTNVFYDSTGKGSLGTSFARLWSNAVNPIEFGGSPTDEKLNQNSSIKCKDHYSKLVSQLWYQVRYLIEADQMRNLSDDLLNEGCMREWTITKGNKIEVEPKEMTKKRMGRSPDLFDALCLAVHGARKLGLNIEKFSNPISKGANDRWIKELVNKRNSLIKKGTLLLNK